ncbi:hypothetical protein ANN_10326, partial [Periplaneta americana]
LNLVSRLLSICYFCLQLPFGPPPVLPDVEKQLKEYLLCPDRLPIHDYEQAQKYWPRERNPCSLYHFDVAPLGTTLKVDRDPTTGKLLQFREVPVDDMGQTAKNSMSLRRAPGPPSEAVRGSSTNYPFWPGGFPELLEDENDEQDAEIDFVNNLLSVPPGFENGLRFKTDGKTPFKEEEITGVDVEEPPLPDIVLEEKVEEPAVVNLMSLVKQEEDLLGLWKDEAKEDEKKEKEKIAVQKIEVDIDVDVSEVVPKEDVIPVLKITETAPLTGPTRTQYAELLDISLPVTDFDKKIPDMAKKWEFELDTFQKKAILKLEEHANVFVAAHTSAGKTVVAEYAIALSKKHMSRSIYTSPIKALSNQKYRDFKETFGDVGLITGDFQINQTAQCLIMTTEILRSMLYCGSEVIRDLEYVIFDEVHYINDSERGHVWEEVLILLPEHVSIVMLSATVPNTLEFADWVGRTKKKKMYVISTLKRPVPLEHYLYTGSGGKSRNDCFLLLNAEGHFKENGYSSAIEAKQSRHNSAMEAKQSRQTAYGPKQGQGKIHLTAKQETTMWVGFLDFLKKKEKLPVVAFTLSRKRCDGNSENLSSVDLTTTKEKSAIHMFFSRCIQNLKPPDQKLPQVVKLEDLLKRGIGVHHSGILPILKEIVEMLFQRGLVKLLFATETFAMGVNMPARTVVFDSIRKFDGLTMRTLLPAEYIQMAGRAGRRGLDKTGTVIIMCKANVPDKTQLKSMMMGKPTKLESKFRLTYSMILNLFRVEKISVEGMMSHSFKEIGHLSHQKVYEKELKQVEEKIKEMSDNPQQQGIHWKPLSEFYDIAIKYLRLWIDVREHMLSHPKCSKELMPGRVLLVSHQEHVNKLGLLLQAADSGKKVYKVLVLCNSEARYRGFEEDIELSVTAPAREEQRSPLWYKMLGLVKKRKLFVPDGLGGHTVITIKAEDILDIVKHKINLDTNLVYQDWDKRQIPRFRSITYQSYASRTGPVAWQQWSEMEALIPSPTACEVRSVIMFFNAQSIAPIEIHRQLCQSHDDGEEFLDRIIMGNETWISHFTPETKQQSMHWRHSGSPVRMKFKQTLSVRKVMCTVFWDRKGILLIDFLPRGETINADRYCETLRKLRRAIQNKRRGMLTAGVVLLHDNARPHTARLTAAVLTEFGWELFDQPPYSPDLAPSDFHVFLHLRKFLSSGERFGNDEELKTDCPPGQTCSQAVQKLTEFTQNVVSETVPLDFVSPTKDIKLSKEGILEDLKQLDLLEKKLNDCSSVNIANFEQLFEDVFQHKQLEEQKKTLQFNKSLKSLSLYPEFENRVIVLQRLDYIDSKKAVKLKGRVACEMGNHELMITEIVLRDILTNKQPAEIAALLSCLVFQQRTESESELTETLMKGIQEIMEVAETLKFTEQECGVGQQDSNEEFEKLNFGLVHVVYQWALKKPFSEIMELTDVQEGIIVRCIQQLNETLRDVKNAAHVIGNPILKEKMQEASDAIKRDIVFAASLYTSEENNQLRARFKEDERLLPVGDE